MSKTTSEPTPNPPPTFEAGLQELESIVKEMETGELPLERAIAMFEQGMKLRSKSLMQKHLNGGRDRTRTCDLLRVKQAL